MHSTFLPDHRAALNALCDFLQRHRRLLVLTGAGISTDSGIPAYRDAQGHWQGSTPTQWRDFRDSHSVRQRYWARSMVGWPTVARAKPNTAHYAIARIQQEGRIAGLVTQNVDGLHQAAGSQDVVELHGNIGSAMCLNCGLRHPRAELQAQLEADNPQMVGCEAAPAADGDAHLPHREFAHFTVPQCIRCAGILKPDVVFFGESVPRHRVDKVYLALAQADALLVIGSSLTVYSGYRFCLAAVQANKPIAAVNTGATRADSLLTLKISWPCSALLADLAPA